MLKVVEAVLLSTFDYAPALIFASLGSVISERAGVINLGVEGMMRVGAYAAAVAALVLPTGLAVVVGMLAGALLAAVHAFLCIRWRSDQVISGMALNLVALSGITFLLESQYSPSGTPSIAQLGRWEIPWLKSIPLLGTISGHSVLTYFALCVPFGLHVFLWRTHIGLRIRVVGEKPIAASTAGISVARVRYFCVLAAGLLCGLGGAALSTSTLDRFEQHMPAGLGFIALAAMVFGRWTPLGAFGAAVLFAFGNAFRIGLSSSIPRVSELVPQGFLLALPYVLTLIAVAALRGKALAPAALGVHGE